MGLHGSRQAIIGALAVLAAGCASGGDGSSCGSDFDCGTGLFCNSSGICQQSAISCASGADCGPNQNCVAGVCMNGCRAAGCPANQTCNRALDLCVTVLVDLGGNGTSGGQGSQGSGTSVGATTGGVSASSGASGSSGGATGTGSAGSGSTTAAGTSGTVGAASASTGGSSSGAGSTGTTTGAACTTDTWANFGGTFFQTYCGQCHSWTQASVSQDGQIASELQEGFMPPRTAKTQPSPEDLNRILIWISCGEP